jgi:ATP-dependent DNA helicase RecG
MILKDDLIVLLNNIESARIERTESINDTDKFSKAVCAFANDLPNTGKPGYLVIGANDRSGHPIGLQVTDELLRNLGGLRSDGNILPLPAISIEKFTLSGGDVAVVEVQPSDMPPVRYKGQVWVRIGPRRAVANEHEERILTERRASHAKNFDIWPVKEAKISDLSQRLFSDYRNSIIDPETIAENHRSIEEQLASLRFFDLLGSCPTFAGILLFGTNPRYYIPGAYIQFLKFPGTVMTDTPTDQLEISGTVPNMADIVKDKIIAYNQTNMKHGDSLRDIITPDYPEWAFREFLHNALIHRDYQSNAPIRFYWFEDRVEIQSPGGLYGRVTVDTMMRVNDYRNPVIAEAMKALGYVNRFGFGIQNAQKLLKENANPSAEITADQHTVLVIIRKGKS